MCAIATSVLSASARRRWSRSNPSPSPATARFYAHVTRIAKDAIPEPDANAIEGDPTRISNAAGFAGGERTQNLVFPVVLKPDVETITVDGLTQPLTSGMAVTVELKTGARRMLEYLFAPLVEVASKAMRER